MMAKDIISCVSLLDFVKLKIAETRNTLGEEQFQFHMDALDSMVSKQLISLLG